MSNQSTTKLVKWFCYTVAIGLIPSVLRFLSSSFIEGIDLISAADFIAFGFVLHISIFNELEHMSGDETWKSFSNTGSIIAIVLYGALMFALLIIESGYDKIKLGQLTNSSMVLASCSFVFCFIVFFRLTAKAKSETRITSHGGESPC
ncbi:hypothetical protein [Photobacterium sp.]|uniref:hypothetical protein n=1 Tax=Photobacterium sp. TaxID=660 RepID=UPI00299EF3B7|nr:hypothetical protein [Photobacterium sp.]MDX1303603.1 hypothetical protein [Photobacterium sp.]